MTPEERIEKERIKNRENKRVKSILNEGQLSFEIEEFSKIDERKDFFKNINPIKIP